MEAPVREVLVGVSPYRLVKKNVDGVAIHWCNKIDAIMYNRFNRIPACDRRLSCDTVVQAMHSIPR